MNRYAGPDRAQPVLASSLVGATSPGTKMRRLHGYVTSRVRFGEQLPLKQRILRFLVMLRPVKSGEGRSKKWQAGANGYGGKV